MLCEDKFKELYRQDPEGKAFCPYRICPIGAHSDFQLGKITGLANNKGIHIAYKPKTNGVVELFNLQFGKRAQWHVLQVPGVKQDDWADYLRGATLYLSEKYPVKVGLSGVIEGELPIGGLSSSAAVVLSFLQALCRVNGIAITPAELVEISVRTENQYVGVSSGKMDQCCEIYTRKNELLHYDCQSDQYESIPFAGGQPLPFKIAVFFSGIGRQLKNSGFNMRVDELRSAAYALKAFSGMEYGKFAETNLREVPREVYDKYKDQLPVKWRLRAEHWYTEFDRVSQGVEAWRKGDIKKFGRLSFESGHSSIYNYQAGSPELKALYDIMSHTDGIYGGRFSGAGFKGCCIALIDPAYSDSIAEQVEREYLAQFTDLRGKYEFHLCESADGLKI